MLDIMKEQVDEPDLQTRVDALETKLEQEQRLRDELISTTSHDLRSPIGAINIFCEILMSGPHPLEEAQKQNVRMIAEAAEKLQRIVEDTVEIARLHGGRAPRVHDLKIADSVDQAIEQLRAVVTQRNVQIEQSIADADAVVQGDAVRIMEVLIRIIGDAVRCCPPGGVVKVDRSVLRESFVMTVVGPRESNCSRVVSDGNVYFPKGKLGVRKPGESRFTWATCERLVQLMGGSLQESFDNGFHVELALPLA